MKKKILSFILAFAMIFSAFLPAASLLPAVDSAALISAQNANIAPVQVGTLGELVFAMENSVAGQTITLTNDIKSTNAYDWQMDISADGILVLDLNGYDIELTRIISENVSVPVIASGGAGTLEHFYDALDAGKADAALAASLFHFKELEIKEVKQYLRDRGISVRL